MSRNSHFAKKRPLLAEITKALCEHLEQLEDIEWALRTFESEYAAQFGL